MDELRIEYLSPDELTPYENNTRKHSPDDIESIKKSILDVGFLDPIGIWGEKNIIVEGHGRMIAAKELMLDKVPVIRLDQLTDAQRREYAKKGILRGEHMCKLYGDVYSAKMTNLAHHVHAKRESENVYFKHTLKPFKVGAIIHNKEAMEDCMRAILKKYPAEVKTSCVVKVKKKKVKK